ncbi:hypothetical protein I6A84_20075 [Frankia sp. CNm7]|uniref:hypothetical protein n=1 Tax=Frankia nepalensis TaxID=1836974 RepID=UPI001931ACB7|nr:hypothetical protein [Frankia nepalensis]MBL7520324.1 hypothetical protein [Frankia nepalensis]
MEFLGAVAGVLGSAADRFATEPEIRHRRPVALTAATVRASAGAGVAISDAGLADPDRLLNASDIAMYAAKRAGTGHCVVPQDWMRLDNP